MTEKKWLLIYDNDCKLCIRYAQLIKKLDKKDLLHTISILEYYNKYNNITLSELKQDVHLLNPENKVFRGSEVAEKLLLLIPQSRPLKWMLSRKRSDTFSRIFYKTSKKIRKICLFCNKR